MIASGQRAVPVKMTPPSLETSRASNPRLVILALALLLSSGARAEDGGYSYHSDAPRILQLPTGYYFNDAAFRTVNAEMKRLQGVERQHKGESWVGVLIIGAGVGLVTGILATWAVMSLASPAPAAGSGNP